MLRAAPHTFSSPMVRASPRTSPNKSAPQVVHSMLCTANLMLLSLLPAIPISPTVLAACVPSPTMLALEWKRLSNNWPTSKKPAQDAAEVDATIIPKRRKQPHLLSAMVSVIHPLAATMTHSLICNGDIMPFMLKKHGQP